MKRETLRSLVVISALLFLGAIVFAGIETKGKLIEARIGFVGVVITAVLLLLAAYLSRPQSRELEEAAKKTVAPPAPPASPSDN